jgi:hypothetical protein
VHVFEDDHKRNRSSARVGSCVSPIPAVT